jgi:nucleotide-binding universal stress UspA family protein
MYKRILVPLDGSKLAESALAHAEQVAKGCGTEELVLVRVTERVQAYTAVDDPSQPLRTRLVPEAIGREEKQARRYLGKIAEAIEAKGIKVAAEVLLGDPAEEIVIRARHPGCDLIVMSSHGRSGIHRWTHGSIADRVFRASPVPVLMVKAQG